MFKIAKLKVMFYLINLNSLQIKVRTDFKLIEDDFKNFVGDRYWFVGWSVYNFFGTICFYHGDMTIKISWATPSEIGRYQASRSLSAALVLHLWLIGRER